MHLTIRNVLTCLFRLVGIEAFFFRRRAICDHVCFDRNMLEWFYEDSEERILYKKALSITGMQWSDNFVKQCRHYTLQKLVNKTLEQSLEGDVAECGCWKGTSSYQIASLMKNMAVTKNLHIFDSFEGGLSDKGPQDKNVRINQSLQEITNESAGFISTEKEVRENLSAFDFIKYYPGWIPGRFKDVDRIKFCFVHIDVDLYEPTKCSLEFFFKRLVVGGVIVVDDYGYTQFPGAKVAVDEFIVRHPGIFFLDSPIGGCFLIKQESYE